MALILTTISWIWHQKCRKQKQNQKSVTVFVLSHWVMSDSLQLHGLKFARLLHPFCTYTHTHDYAVLSCVWLLVTPCTVACQDPLSMEFCRQEYWNGLPFPPPGELLDPGIELASPALQMDALVLEPSSKPCCCCCCFSCSVLSNSFATPLAIAH